MSEEEFQRQEQKRQESERIVEAVRSGGAVPNTLQGFINSLSAQLNENPILKEFILYIAREHNDTVIGLRELFDTTMSKQNLHVDQFASELKTLSDKINELQDNFNIFMSKILEQNTTRLALVSQAVDAIKDALF